MSLFIWRQFEQGSVGQGMAMSVVTILMTTMVMVAVTLWQLCRRMLQTIVD